MPPKKRIIFHILALPLLLVFTKANYGATDTKTVFANIGAGLVGLESAVIIHEGGHAVMTWVTGGTVTAFKPYPHICGENFALGCVEGYGGNRFLTSLGGTLFSNLAFLAIVPYQFDIRPQHQWFYKMVKFMTYVQMTEMLAYVSLDAFGYGGDWHNIANAIGVPTWALLPLAVANYYGLYLYRKHWFEKKGSAIADVPLGLSFQKKF